MAARRRTPMPLALILVRWLHLSASMLLAGLFLLEAVVVPGARKPSADVGHLLGRIHQLTCRTALWTLLTALISWFAWSWLAASTMSGDDLVECLQSGDWLTVLTGTQFGHIWLFRVIVSLVFASILWATARAPSYRLRIRLLVKTTSWDVWTIRFRLRTLFSFVIFSTTEG